MPAPATQRRELAKLLRSVVKVVTVSDTPDYDQPWQTQGATTSAGSGVVIETPKGPRILTNAHCVEHHVFVEVRRYGNAQKFVAQVEAIGHECDLALLNLEDPEFFTGITPLPLGPLPNLGDDASVCGFPIGGERLSITNGVISRIEVICYAHSQRQLLGVQLDAAINSGNSGGPVLSKEKVVGIAFQALDEAEQIGYMIAAPVIQHFLEDAQNGAYRGFPCLGINTQSLESSAHRAHLLLPGKSRRGILITQVAYEGSAWGVLKAGDVLLEIDGTPIEGDGTVRYREGEMLAHNILVANHHIGESITLKIWRDGETLRCVVPLKGPQQLVAEASYHKVPSYTIFGGLLLVPLTLDYLKTWDDWWLNAPRTLVALYESEIPTRQCTEPVVLQKVLADRVNQGYHDVENLLIHRCQGKRVRNLKHLISLLSQTTDNFIRLEAADGQQIVLDRQLAIERNPKILKRFRVPYLSSKDLRPKNKK